MRKLFMVSCGIVLSCFFTSLFAHGNGDGHDISDPSGIQYDNISGNTALRRSTCRVFGTDETYLQQALGYHNDLVIDNGDGVADRRCYWSLIFMSAYTMRITSPMIFRGEPMRTLEGESGAVRGVLIDLNPDPTTASGFVTFVLDARGLGDCPMRFERGVKAQIEHLTILVDNPRKVFCRVDGTTPLYSSLHQGSVIPLMSQNETDKLYADIDSSVIIQPVVTFSETSGASGSGGISGGTGGVSGSSGTGGFGSGGVSGSSGALGSGGVSGNGTGGRSGNGGGTGGLTGSGGSSSAQVSTSVPVLDAELYRVDPGGCNKI